MSLLHPLPIPADDWLRKANERYHAKDMPTDERPLRALEEWAAQHGQPAGFGRLALSHLGAPAWTAIDSFFRAHTKLGNERTQPLGRSVWFYDSSFYAVNLFVILGGSSPASTVNPFKCLEEAMPKPLLWEFSRDEPKVQEYLDHLSNSLDSFVSMSRVFQDLKKPLSRNFLVSAETLLASGVSDLLDTRPNTQAAGHARLAFEASLKALLAEKEGLTGKEAASDIGHHLDRLLKKMGAAPCARLILPHDLACLRNAAKDSTSSRKARQLFPDVGARYDAAILPGHRLWECYATAQHAFTTVLRALGGSYSRELQRIKEVRKR